jgi:ribosomal-protein-alanine N-acetyltransferase
VSDIREATDLSAMVRLHALSFEDAWDEAALRGLLSSPGTIGLTAEQDAGFILVRVVADEAEILTICVAPERRCSGLGAALLKAAGSKAAAAGARTMFLEVAADNAPARALYAGHGFEPVGTRKAYYRGRDALVLKAPLPFAETMGNASETL